MLGLYGVSPTTWKRIFDDLMAAWMQRFTSLSLLLDFLNNIVETGKIKFTMEFGSNEGLDILDLKLKTTNDKIRVDVFSITTNSFTYVLPSIYYRK